MSTTAATISCLAFYLPCVATAYHLARYDIKQTKGFWTRGDRKFSALFSLFGPFGVIAIALSIFAQHISNDDEVID